MNKIKGLIPEMKVLMKQNENVYQIREYLGKLNKLCEWANTAQHELLPLLPQDEVTKQDEWFSGIWKYTETFQNNVKQWIKETEHQTSQEQKLTETNEPVCFEEQIGTNKHLLNIVNVTEDDVRPSNSVSKCGSHKSSQSQRSTTSSARLQAEAELAALATKQRLLEERHALEEEEERLRKRKEKLQLRTEIAEKIAKLNILKLKVQQVGKGHQKFQME